MTKLVLLTLYIYVYFVICLSFASSVPIECQIRKRSVSKRGAGEYPESGVREKRIPGERERIKL